MHWNMEADFFSEVEKHFVSRATGSTYWNTKQIHRATTLSIYDEYADGIDELSLLEKMGIKHSLLMQLKG